MTATGHAIIGTVIAAKIGNPWLAIPIALVSHLAADAFPHWDCATNYKKKSRTRLFIDSAMDVAISFLVPALLVIGLFPQTNLLYAYIISFFALFWDWTTAPYFFFNMKFPPFSWSYNLQVIFDNRLDKPWGIIGQVVVLILIVLLGKLL